MSDMKCRLLWKLCRRHGWGSPISKDGFVNLALEDVDQGRGKEVVEELLKEPYIGYQGGKGFSIRNDPDSQAQVAFRLRTTCEGYSDLQIEATLSRFQQAGGFDSYTEEVLDSLPKWE